MKHAAVCDDDADSLKQTETLCRRYFRAAGEEASVTCFQDAESLLRTRAHYDIYLLDILMPGTDGISLAKKLKRQDRNFCIIYLTVSEEYALDAFSVNALQYLVRPVEEKALFEALQRAELLLCRPETKETRLAVPTPHGTVSVRLSRLCCVEHLNRSLHFHMADGTVVRSSVSSMKISGLAEKLLALPNFLSPHRAFLVNMDYILSFSSEGIRMDGGQTVPVARANHAQVRRLYIDYLLEQKGKGKC